MDDQENLPISVSKKHTRPARRRNKLTTEADKKAFLENVSKGMTIRQAAENACHPASTFQALTHRDPEFKKAYETAKEIGTDVIEQEVYRRAVEGYLEPVVGKVAPGIDGQVLGPDGEPMFIRRYSDKLAERLLVGRRPEYRDNPRIDISNQTLNVNLDDRSAALDAVAKVLRQAGVDVLEASEDPNSGGASYKELPDS